jgi:hypothetical protein
MIRSASPRLAMAGSPEAYPLTWLMRLRPLAGDGYGSRSTSTLPRSSPETRRIHARRRIAVSLAVIQGASSNTRSPMGSSPPRKML